MIRTSWRLDPRFHLELGGSSPPPVYQPPPPTPPDPTATANAQQGYNINSAVAQAQLNNMNQQTPYGSINYYKTGGSYIGGGPGTPGTAATGGYWNGSSWVPTGGTPGTPASNGTFVPTYTATTSLSPQVQGVVNTGLQNAQISAWTEQDLLKNAKNAMSKPLDLSWGNIASNIYGLEKHTLDPQWAQASQVNAQSLADQGLTPGSQGAGYQNTQFGIDKGNAYNNAMLGAQGQAVQDITAQYNSPINMLNALRSGSQVQQPGVGQTAATQGGTISPAPYANVAQGNYATGSQNFNNSQQLLNSQYQTQAQQQSQLMGGLFGLGGSLLGGLGSIASDRRLKTDIQKFGKDPENKLPLYAYRYEGDPKSYPKVVGPMAQDVKRVAPEAVKSEEGGHLAIDTSAYFGLGGKV